MNEDDDDLQPEVVLNSVSVLADSVDYEDDFEISEDV